MSVAHKIGESPRTDDVVITESVDFAGLLLSKNVLRGLQNSGFERPSPIQLKAIPLGRCGLDLIVQAKSGTGKTCVFAVIALESLQVQAQSTQVLVLAPTREIAIQIWEVIGSLGSAIPGMYCHTFIGGMPLHEDKKKLQLCHIAVGTPGRIQNLIEAGNLKTESIRLFVLDEADKLLEDSFQEQINWIYSALPDNKQILALSATYPESLAQHLTMYMRNPTFIRLNITDPTLLGIKQYFTSVSNHPLPNKVFEAKTAAVIHLLSSVSFHQCLIFSNMQTRAQNLESELTSCGWPTACIAGSLEQKDRITAMAKLKSYQCRILISTDLSSRGIDADKVNLVINMDIPKDHETYLHRIGRAGRFGSYGAAVTIISEGQELLDLQALERKISTHIPPLPDPIPCDLVKHQLQVKLDDVVSTEQFITQPHSKGCGMLGLSMATESQSTLQNLSGGHSYNEHTNKLLPEVPLGTMEEEEKVGIVKYEAGENCHASPVKSSTSKLSYIQNGFPEKILSVSSKDGHFEVGVNGHITSTESTDFKNHSSDEAHVDVDDKITFLEPNIENTDFDLSMVKELVGAEENYPKVSSESKDAADQTNTTVKEDRDTVVISDPSGENLAASSRLRMNDLDDVLDSEVTSANCLSLCDAHGGQIKTMTDELNINMVTSNITKQSILPADSSASDKNQVSSCTYPAQNDIHLSSLSSAVETLAEDSSLCSKLCLDKAQNGQRLDESCLSKSKGEQTLEDVCLNETKRRQALEEKFSSKTEMGKTSAEIQLDSEKKEQKENTSTEVSMWHSSDYVDSAAIGTDGHSARCNNAPLGHQEHSSASPAEMTECPQTLQGLNRDTLEGNGINPSVTKVKNKTSRINAAATLWGDMLGKDFQEQEKRGSSNTLKALNRQSKKSTLDTEYEPLTTQSNSMGKQKTKISSGACAVAKLWGDMLSSDSGDANDCVADEMVSKSSKQHRERKPHVNSAEDRQSWVPRDSENMEQNLVQGTQDQKEESQRVKDGERKQIKMEQLSWESELALYVAARAKLNASKSSDKGEIKETADVFTRPQKQARRRLAGVKKSSAAENSEKASSADSLRICHEAAQNREELEEKIQMTETISAKISPTRIAKNCLDKDSVRLDHLPETTENESSAAETIAKKIPKSSQAKEKTQTVAEEKQQTTDNTMTGLESQQSSVVSEESDAATLGRLHVVGFNDDDFSTDNSTSAHRLMSMKSVSQKNNLQDFEKRSSHLLETPGVRSILARLSASQSTNWTHSMHTYSAALQDYSLFLEQASSIDPPSVLNIVNNTFRSSSALPSADDLKEISEFLHNFHGDIQHRVLSENMAAAGSDLQISSVKEKGFDKATQTDCSVSHVSGVEPGHIGMLTPKCESCSAVVKPILVSPVEPIPSECCDDVGKVLNDVQTSQVEIQTKISFQRERELPVLPLFSPPKGTIKQKHVDRKNRIAAFPAKVNAKHEELPQTIAMNKMNAVNGQGNKLLLMKHRGDQEESPPNKQEQPVQEGACRTPQIGKNILHNNHTSQQLPAKQTTGFLETEAEESFVSSLDSSSLISSDNEETEATAAEKPEERNTGFYKNRYADEAAVPRVPPSKVRGSKNDELARKRHVTDRKSKNLVSGFRHNDTKRCHQTSGFFTNEVNPYLDTLNFWHAWYYRKPGGYSNIPAQIGVWRNPCRPCAWSGASSNLPHLYFPHNDHRADWFHSGSVPGSPAAYFPEGKNCRHFHKPQDPATLYVQSLWSRAKTQQEYIRQMVGFYKEMSKSQPSFFKNSN